MTAEDRRTRQLRELLEEQANDDGLWFVADSIVEAYLQQELRKLHAAVEAVLDTEGDRQEPVCEVCGAINDLTTVCVGCWNGTSKWMREAKGSPDRYRVEGWGAKMVNVRTGLIAPRSEANQQTWVRADTEGDQPTPPVETVCPCGHGDAPWHWPRHGFCNVGLAQKAALPDPPVQP